MATKGSQIKFETANEELGKIPAGDLAITEQFITGDHWQNGNGWIGWVPESSSEEAQKQFMMVVRLFNAKNVCGGMVDRVRGATLGKEPDWEVVKKRDGTESEQTTNGKAKKPVEFQKIDIALLKWWNDKKVHSKLKEFISNKAAYGKAAIRIYIPSGYVQSNGSASVIRAKDLDEALSKIFIEVPRYDSFIDPIDIEFGQKYTVLKLAKASEDDPEKIEITYIDENGMTVVRQVSDVKDDTGTATNPLDLRGQPLTYVHGDYEDALISETVKAQQRAVNHAKTGENFALANINFPETTFINAALPTETVTGSNGKKVEVVKPMAQGMGRWRSLMGLVTQRFDGSEELAKPEVIYREGADPERFARVAENNTRDMHQEAGMLYIYLADSEYASGDARIEAMTDYLILLVDYKTVMDTTGEWLISTVLNFAYNLLQQPEKIDTFDVIFSSKLTIGRLSTDDKRTMMEEVAAGLRSKRNYMVTAEVSDDPDSELQVIKVDQPEIDPATGLPKGAGMPSGSTGADPATKPKSAGAGS